MKERGKKVVFFMICLLVSLLVVFIFATTIYNHVASYSKGIVHWHAGLNIYICGRDLKLPSPQQWYSNKVGTHVLHHHDDMRVHVEGIVKNVQEASLGSFFDAINVQFTNRCIWGWCNGDFCPNSKSPGNLKMFVNGQPNYEFRNYIISPYFTLEEEDKIDLIFD